MAECMTSIVLWRLLGKDNGIEQATKPGEMNVAKQVLQELEDHINYATFMLAAGLHQEEYRKRIEDWISEARKTAFCLADQIAMYATQKHCSDDYKLYHMKCHIGMLSIQELIKRIKDHKDVGEGICKIPTAVPSSESDRSQLSEISPFIRHSTTVQALPRTRMVDKIKEVDNFLTGPCPVLYITGGQCSGKTTLMRDVYTSQKQKMDAEHRINIPSWNHCCWVDVAKTGGLVGLLKELLVESNENPDSIGEFEIMKKVHETFSKCTRYLIVLDNVQDTSVYYNLKQVLQGCRGKIICLTRTDIQQETNQSVLRMPGALQGYDSYMLLLTRAFPTFNGIVLSRENINIVTDDVLREAVIWKDKDEEGRSSGLPVRDLGRKVDLLRTILSKCTNNYSWNIQSIGAQLAGNPLDKWEEIEKRIDGKHDPSIELEEAKLGDAAIRRCFLYCLAFPEASETETSEILENSGGIPTRKLIRLWTAEGYVQKDSTRHSQEQEAENLLEELIKKNLLVVTKKCFDGEVLKCSVNKHIRALAEKMCEQQKFCRVVLDEVDPAPSPGSRLTKCFPASPNIRILRKKTLSDRYRMLAVHGTDRGVKEASKALSEDIRLRSLLHFRTRRIEHSDLHLSFQRTCMLLRTLELEGARLARLPSSIGCLVCLRYLGLRNTQLEYLPPTLERLSHLMCLDIRDNHIAEVANVSEFTEMRHLYLTSSFRDHSVLIREGLQSLIHLQTLSGAAYGEPRVGQSSGMVPFEKEIEHLKRLRKLSIKKASCTSSETICHAINRMDYLQSLTISCDDRHGRHFDPSTLNIGNNLRKLKLGGPTDMKFRELGPKMKFITYLYLWDNKLPVDLLQTLQGLKELLLLSLLNASTMAKMICGNGYRKLKKLSIMSMENLSECKFGTGAMANLEELVFAKCGKLKSPPPNLLQLGSLRKVHLAQMLTQFCKETEDKLREQTGVQVQVLERLFHTSSSAATGGGS